MTHRHGELDERNESPMGARPFLVRMAAEAAIGFLSAQKRADERSGEDPLEVRFDALARARRDESGI
jgi:hypothetical protein